MFFLLKIMMAVEAFFFIFLIKYSINYCTKESSKTIRTWLHPLDYNGYITFGPYFFLRKTTAMFGNIIETIF